jgi:hypothetical protein
MVKALKSYRGMKVPRNIGRPAMFLRAMDDYESIRIVFPNGRVEYAWNTFNSLRQKANWGNGCTCASNYYGAMRKIVDYDKGFGRPIFVGYL